MKKYLALIITAVILSLSLCVPAFAANEKVITFSEDYKEMYFNGNTYTRVDASMLIFTDYISELIGVDNVFEEDYIINDTSYASIYKTNLSQIQENDVKTVNVINVSNDETIFFIMITFNDGSDLSIDFIREDLVQEYNKVLSGETKEYIVDFIWPDGNTVAADKDKFFVGEKNVVNYWVNTFETVVYASSATGSFDAEIGAILKFGEKYCFFSFVDSDIKSTQDFWQYDDLEIEVIELTDEELLSQLKEAEQKYLDDNYGYLFNEDFTEPVAKFFFTFVFGLFPLAIAVITLIIGIKSKKGVYKKLLLTTSGLSIASLITFIYIAFTLFNK